jgi:hypothetical protein
MLMRKAFALGLVVALGIVGERPLLAALTFGANSTDVVDFSTPPVVPDPNGTVMVWIYTTDDTVRQRIFQIQEPDLEVDYRGDLANDLLNIVIGRSVSYAHANANAGSYAAFGLNKWLCIVFAYNLSGGATDSKAYVGI